MRGVGFGPRDAASGCTMIIVWGIDIVKHRRIEPEFLRFSAIEVNEGSDHCGKEQIDLVLTRLERRIEIRHLERRVRKTR